MVTLQRDKVGEFRKLSEALMAHEPGGPGQTALRPFCCSGYLQDAMTDPTGASVIVHAFSSLNLFFLLLPCSDFLAQISGT